MQRPVAQSDREYQALLEELKGQIRAARTRAALAASRELLLLYWDLGRAILTAQGREGWGATVIDRLGADLRAAFREAAGFSPRNLKYMRAFAHAYPDRDALVQHPVARLPWGHVVRLLDKVADPDRRAWYAAAAYEHGWSRTILELQIESRLAERQGAATTNFARTLPAPDSDLAQQALKDPYVFDFLTLHDAAKEQELERGLLAHVERFLLELGAGFAYVGRQVRLEVGGEEYRLDLLFYHLKLRCFVVVDLTAGPFKPEYAGKLNFYLSAVDDQMRHPDDRPSIGLLLCRTRNRTIVEYALRDVHKLIGVAEWEIRLVASLPAELQGSLPTVEELERELGGPADGDG